VTFDDFFRNNYGRIVRYVHGSCGYFNRADCEEIAQDVIADNYQEYASRVVATEQVSAESKMRRWMIRRARFDMLNLLSKGAKEREGRDDTEQPEVPCMDDPADWLCLKQRLPVLPEILLNYETYVDGVPVDRNLTKRHHRAKKLFLCRLKGTEA
jgi:DNA-directed RNA polymerase specialized sigma24 family protein